LQGRNLQDIEAHISKPRLHTYIQLTGSPDTATLIGAYQWNKRVASAIYPILQCLEVSLRNAIQMAATRHFATPDWYDQVTKIAGHSLFNADMRKNPYKLQKFYRNHHSVGARKGLKIWTSHHENMINTAKEKLVDRGITPTADAVIAELMFGFWVGMFTSSYSDIHSKKLLWPHLMPKVFPNLASSERTATKIHIKLKALQYLRNRLSHHEPVWKHPTVNSASKALTYLNEVVDDAVTLINGMSKDRKNLLYMSGKISYFKGICSQETLDYYLAGTPAIETDIRHLKRFLTKAITSPQVAPIIVSSNQKPKLVVDLFLP
jgi:Abi-like protein